jgi:hypothetical protein
MAYNVCHMQCEAQNAEHYIITSALVQLPYKFWSSVDNY